MQDNELDETPEPLFDDPDALELADDPELTPELIDWALEPELGLELDSGPEPELESGPLELGPGPLDPELVSSQGTYILLRKGPDELLGRGPPEEDGPSDEGLKGPEELEETFRLFDEAPELEPELELPELELEPELPELELDKRPKCSLKPSGCTSVHVPSGFC